MIAMRNPHRSGLAVVAGLIALAALPGSRVLRADEPVLAMRAVAVNMTGVGAGSVGTLDITIERWSTDQERAKLKDILIEKGSDKLLDALHDMKPRVGFIRTSQSLGWDLGFARETPLPGGGRRIVIATDRPMSFRERVNKPRSADYEFLLVEIRLDDKGKGQGKLVGAGKIEYNQETNTLEIENYGIEPVRLTQVDVLVPKPKK